MWCRHLLQELTVPTYIANDTCLKGGLGDDAYTQRLEGNPALSEAMADNEEPKWPSMLIMTGPNYSGKSVFLKQIAIIVYMAHVGSFVPADQAVIGITDKIITRVATKESVSKAQSSFMIDLQQIALAVSLATRRSLVIIDEFGKGTESKGMFAGLGKLRCSHGSLDGAGLACGVLEYFLGLGAETPKVLAATHFHEIFETRFLKPGPGLDFGHMEVRLDTQAETVENQITYLYTSVELVLLSKWAADIPC